MENTNNIMPLEERIENAYPSSNGLYPHEILALHLCEKYYLNQKKFQGFWHYVYGVYDLETILKTLSEKGFIKLSSITKSLVNYKNDDLKRMLKSHGLCSSGKKADLINRLLENIDIKDLNNINRYFELTEKGIQEAIVNKYILDFHKKPVGKIGIWEANKILNENPNRNIESVIIEKIDESMEMYIQNYQINYLLRDLYSAIRYNIENENYINALKYISYDIYLEVNAARSSQNDFIDEYTLDDYFPYKTSFYKINVETVNQVAIVKHSLSLDNENLEELMMQFLNDFKLKFEMFEKKECILIALLTMKGNINDVEKIYEEVEYRTRENFVYLRNNFIVDPIENENMQLKEEVLLDCFESLSEDVVSNCDNIADIFSQLQENRSELVLELWKSLIENKWDDILKGGDDYNSISACLTSRIMSVLVENRYFNKIEKKLLSESRILEAVYQQSPSLPPSSTFIVGKLLRQNDFENASKIMEYIYSNNKNNFVKDSDFSVCSFSYMFKMWIENYIITSSSYGIFGGQLGRTIGDKKDIYDFLDYWCDEINDEKERNRVKIYLMRLI